MAYPRPSIHPKAQKTLDNLQITIDGFKKNKGFPPTDVMLTEETLSWFPRDENGELPKTLLDLKVHVGPSQGVFTAEVREIKRTTGG